MQKKYKIVISILAILGITFCSFAVGWLPPTHATFTGSSYAWTNSSKSLVDIPSVLFLHDQALANTVTLWYVDIANSKEYKLDQGTNSALQWVLFTPPGNGHYSVAVGDSIKITHGKPAFPASVTINPRTPE